MPASVLMVQGTASSVGKSLLVAGLCRVLSQDGFRVAPFKAQNMSLNAAVTLDGLEISRAQAVQAEAAGVEPSVDMNPILLKPEGEARSQLVVRGRVVATLAAREFYARKAELWPVVADALARLRAAYEVVIIEGAGSPAEVNLRATDLANMRVALHARAPVLLVGDIDRGGVFASLVGTLELLDRAERELVRGLVINKFRGDRSLLAPGLEFLARRTGKPVLGVLPYLPGLTIADEDSAGLEERRAWRSNGELDIAVIRLPRLANFDDFDLLAAEPSVRLRYVASPSELGEPDLLVLPGTKTTLADLRWLRQTGLAERVLALARAGTPLLGICGGYQMLGERLADPEGIESEIAELPGLALLPARTVFQREKRTRRVLARPAGGQGWLGRLEAAVPGYEIHVGRTACDGPPAFLVRGEGEAERPDGCVGPGGLVVGTYLHGLFEARAARQALLAWLGARRGLRLQAGAIASRQAAYDRLAEALREHLDLAAVRRLAGL